MGHIFLLTNFCWFKLRFEDPIHGSLNWSISFLIKSTSREKLNFSSLFSIVNWYKHTRLIGRKFFFEATLFPPAEILLLWNYRNKWSFQPSKFLHGFIRCIYFIREDRHQLLQISCLFPQNMSQRRARHLQLSTAQSWSKHKRNLR